MRLRNLKNKEAIFKASVHLVEKPEQYRGNVMTLFPKKQPLHVEIGMGKGDFLIAMAKKYPNINFIGIEKFDNVLARALPKIEKSLSNIRIYRYDAKDIGMLFCKEVDKVYLNFSDPWPKKRKEKNRLTSALFLKQYDTIFKDQKEIEMKTDNVPFFLYSLEMLSQNKYQLYEISLDYHKDLAVEPIMTEYEKKFTEKKIPICHVRALKDTPCPIKKDES